MTASDHATKPFRKTLRERGHPYMVLGACSASRVPCKMPVMQRLTLRAVQQR
jgi:hypothetical protein